MGSEQELKGNRFHAISRIVSLSVIVLTVAVIVVAFVRTRRQTRPPGPLRSAVGLKADVVSIIEGYNTVRTENGRETLRLTAARDIAYSDGHHELEEVDLTSFGEALTGESPASNQPKYTRIVAKRGSYRQAEGLVTFEGAVKVTSSDGLVVETDALHFEQHQRVASTELAVTFRQGEIEGHSIGGRLSVGSRRLELLKDVRIVTYHDTQAASADREPVTIRSQIASYDETDGRMWFEGQAVVTQGGRTARANSITGWLTKKDPQSDRRLQKIELRGGCQLTSSAAPEPAVSDIVAAEIDFHFGTREQLEQSVARGDVRASAVDSAGLPRSILAPLINVDYQVVGNRSRARQLTAQGRATARFDAPEAGKVPADITERLVEADVITAHYREDGESFARIDAAGGGLLTVTPRRVTPLAERKTLRADRFALHFAPTGNRILRFEAVGQVVGEFEFLHPESKRPKRTLAGRRLDALFDEKTQDLSTTTMEGAVRFTEADRIATGGRAEWTAATRLVTLRGRPQIWDSTARADAEEIDIRLESNESHLRGRVRTTWFSQESTGGATPFRRRQSPVSVVSDRAIINHPDGSPESARGPGGQSTTSALGGHARYTGNVRAWQDSEFIRADQLDLDRAARTLHAVGKAQSAYYQLEREIEKGRKLVVPVFASADQIRYDDGSRRTFYDGEVKIRQGADSIEAANAEALMDQEHRLLEMVAAGQIVLTQPERIARGERLVYNFTSGQATLTGRPASIEDRQQQVQTTGEKLVLNSRDGRFEAGDDRATRSRVRTTHRVK